MEVSVREFRNHLAKYLRLVKGGEALAITSHRRVVGYLSPAPPETDAATVTLATASGILWSGGKPAAARHGAKMRRGREVAALVVDDRGPRE